jgi:hypothetical protein
MASCALTRNACARMNVGILPPNKLFDTDAQVRPRRERRFYSLCAGRLRR